MTSTPVGEAPVRSLVGRPDLEAAIRGAWSAATSASSTWSAETPSEGQCAVTALVLQDFLGGDLLRAVVCGQSHYWNRLPDGSEVDLTAEQFVGYSLEGRVEVRSRLYALSVAATRWRYEMLRSRVEAQL